MLSALEQMVRDFWVRNGRPPQLAEYTPYLLAIGSMLAWFVRGLIGDCVRDVRYRLRRRGLRVVAGRPAAFTHPLRSRS